MEYMLFLPRLCSHKETKHLHSGAQISWNYKSPIHWWIQLKKPWKSLSSHDYVSRCSLSAHKMGRIIVTILLTGFIQPVFIRVSYLGRQLSAAGKWSSRIVDRCTPIISESENPRELDYILCRVGCKFRLLKLADLVRMQKFNIFSLGVQFPVMF